MKLDPEARYAKTHEWARWDGKEIVCGISDHAQNALSDIVYVELPDVGDALEKGDIFGTIESVKAASDVYMPMGGEITAVNEDLEDVPELVNKDPYGRGWMFSLKMEDPNQLKTLLTAQAYAATIKKEEH